MHFDSIKYLNFSEHATDFFSSWQILEMTCCLVTDIILLAFDMFTSNRV